MQISLEQVGGIVKNLHFDQRVYRTDKSAHSALTTRYSDE